MPHCKFGTSRQYQATGALYYYKGAILWVDNVDDAGSGYLFEKQEEVTDEPADEL